MSVVKHPGWIDPKVKLGDVASCFGVLTTVKQGLAWENDQEVIDAFLVEALSEDYDHLLEVAMVYAGLRS